MRVEPVLRYRWDKLIRRDLRRLRKDVALHPNPLKRMVIFKIVSEIENLLE